MDDEFAKQLGQLSPAWASLHHAGWVCQSGEYAQASALAEEALRLAALEGRGEVVPFAESLIAACRALAAQAEDTAVIPCALCEQPSSAPAQPVPGAFVCGACVAIGRARVAALRAAGNLRRSPPRRPGRSTCSFCGVSPKALGALSEEGEIAFCEDCFVVVGGGAVEQGDEADEA
jgi:hypothetical protein